MKLKYTLAAAIGLAGLSLGVSTPAAAATPEPVMLAMASYAAATAGEDAVLRIAKKEQAYKEQQKKYAEHGHAAGTKDCDDCSDCTDCVTVANVKSGLCDEKPHAAGGMNAKVNCA